MGRTSSNKMRRPQHAEAFLLDQRAHDVDDALARADVEADGRLVEQQQRGLMQQRAGDLDAPGLAAGKVAHFLVARGRRARRAAVPRAVAPARFAAARCRASAQWYSRFWRQRQIEIERAALEHDAEPLQRRRGAAPDVVAENADLAGDVVVEAGDSANSVDLPAPLRPSSTTKRPRGIFSDTSLRARFSPKLWLTFVDDERGRAGVRRMRFRCHIHTTISPQPSLQAIGNVDRFSPARPR